MRRLQGGVLLRPRLRRGGLEGAPKARVREGCGASRRAAAAASAAMRTRPPEFAHAVVVPHTGKAHVIALRGGVLLAVMGEVLYDFLHVSVSRAALGCCDGCVRTQLDAHAT